MSSIWLRLMAFFRRKPEDPRDSATRRERDEQARRADRTADARVSPHSSSFPY